MKKLLMSISFIALVGSILPADAASTLAIGGGANVGNVTMLTGAGALATLGLLRRPTASTRRSVAALLSLHLRGVSARASARPSVSPSVSPVR